MLLGATTIVSQSPLSPNACCGPKQDAAPYYRVRSCDTGLTSGSPAAQYQRQKIIQNSVRVASSLYTMNLGSLSSFETAAGQPDRVPWNQMSDRAQAHVQRVVTSSGSAYGGNSLRRSLVRMRPGAMSPGGSGVDIKHNSYERRLNRLKGRAVLRRGPIPPTFGQPIVFNRAHPVYGGKTILTNIVQDCVCPPGGVVMPTLAPNDIYDVTYHYSVGQNVYSKQHGHAHVELATIVANLGGGFYSVRFSNGVVESKGALEILPAADCICPVPDLSNGNPFHALDPLLKYENSYCGKDYLINSQIQTIINTIIG